MNQRRFNFNQKKWDKKAEDWIENNKVAFDLFCQLSLERSKSGKVKIGAKAIVEAMRWNETLMPEKDEPFKMNNNYTAYLAQKAIEQFPQLKNVFRFR